MRFDPVRFGYLVDGMELAEIGSVMKVFGHLWQFGPMNEVELKRVCRGNFEAVRERMFEVDGLLSFEMIEEAREMGKRQHLQRVKAGEASAAKRNDRSTTVEQPSNERSTSALSKSQSLSSGDNSGKERAREPKASKPDLAAPDHLAAPWAEWLAHRRSQRKPVPLHSQAKLLERIHDWGLDRMQAAVDHSIMMNYQGLFEPRTNGHATNNLSDDEYARQVAIESAKRYASRQG